MPVFDPNPDGPNILDMIEELGLRVSEAYTVAELKLLRLISDRINQGLDVTDPLARVQALQELNAQARNVLAQVNATTLVEQAIRTAVTEGAAAAVARLNMAPKIRTAPKAGYSAQQAQQVVALTAQLQGGLTSMTPTILRSVQDVYQRVVGEGVTQKVIQGLSTQETRRSVVAKLLDQGLTGFVDKSGRQWGIGTYADMAVRTATNRSYEDAHVARMAASGVDLVTIIVGAGADKHCMDWAGKVMSNDGQTGTRVVQSAAEDRLTTVTVAGTLDQARSAGWGHPNCRCSVVGYIPGLSIPADATTYSPEAEKARQFQRYLERRKRAALARVEFAPDDLARAQAKRQVTEANRRISRHVNQNNLTRRRERESLNFQTGK